MSDPMRTEPATGALVPVDLVTALSAYLKVRELGMSFLLESVEQGRLGRYSLVGWGTRVVPFEEAEAELAAGRPIVGYLGYDHVARLEPVPLPREGPDLAESRFLVADGMLRFDLAAGVGEVIAGDPGAVAELLEGPTPAVPSGAPPAVRAPVVRSPDRETFESWVRRAKGHIEGGDAFQIVLSQRAVRPSGASAVQLYRRLRRINPSPYLFLLELGDLALVGSSPETLVKLEGDRASLNPIAGTTPRGEGDAERLLASAKDRAEHVMLVDLGRNDLSRVCVPGTVTVERFLQPERYSHVTHLVSEVAGRLAPGLGALDLLRACFPAGTVSGAPKVRAMQLISEIEGYRRGAYAGAVGYALPDGTLDTCITIRTVLLEGGMAHLQAGAGVVADSDPAAEHRECLNKLAALEAAVEEAEPR